MERNKPVKVLWDGNIKAAIFANQSASGPVFNTSYARIYTDANGQTKEAYSFSGVENLRVSELARKAHHTTNELRKAYNENAARHRSAKPQTASAAQSGSIETQSAQAAFEGEAITADMFEPPAA